MNDNFIPTTLERGAALARLLSRIDGSTVYLRLVEISDAQQILDWRLDPELSRYLSPAEDSLKKQTDYLRAYKRREAEGKEFYYMICRRDNDTPAGCIRMYDIGETSACWGSWILDDNKTFSAAIESAMLLYALGFTVLRLHEFLFAADADGARLVVFHERLGARRIGEGVRGDSRVPEYHFCFDRAAYDAAAKKFGQFIPPAVRAATNEENTYE